MVAAALLAGAACEDPFVFDTTGPPSVATVTLTPDTARLVPGDVLTFVVAVRDSAGNTLADRAVTWTSSASGVVGVDAAGVATALAPGAAIVVATAEGKADSAALTVVPVTVTGVAAGGLHTCAVANTGRTYCWGAGLYGQLGAGFITFIEPLPVATAGPAPSRVVGAGQDHSCGLSRDSTATCWGRNTDGQLGRGASPGDPTLPAPVALGLRFVGIAGGDQHSCALAADSLAYCWGGNVEGQLGDSQAPSRDTPVAVAGGQRFGRLSTGGVHSCAIGAGGAAWCWGADQRGQLGDSAAGANRRYPVRVRGASGFTDIAAGGEHSCGLLGTEIMCWGDNTRGQLGTGAADSFAVAPVPVPAGAAATAVTAGGRHSCALAADSTAFCWGANDRGQVGDGSTIDRPAPVPVAGGARFIQLSAGGEHTCGLTAGGVVHCWGAGTAGQLGAGSTADSAVPVTVGLPGSGAARAATDTTPRRRASRTLRASRRRGGTPPVR